MCFLAIYYLRISIFAIQIEDLPWNYHAYFGSQVMLFVILIIIRRYEMHYLFRNERISELEEQVLWRVLKFDASRSLVFLIDSILSFALFRVNELFEYGYEVETYFNYGFFAYLVYCCFIGGFYSCFITCDVVVQFRKRRRRVFAVRQNVADLVAQQVARREADIQMARDERQQQLIATRKAAQQMIDALQKLATKLDESHTRKHNECTICLEPWQEGSSIVALPCDSRHFFHTECIVSWANKRNYRCPLCNKAFDIKDLKQRHKMQSRHTRNLAASTDNRTIQRLSIRVAPLSSERVSTQDDLITQENASNDPQENQ